MRDLHTRMLAGLLAGEGLDGIAALAAEEAGGPVAIVLPARGLAAASSAEIPLDDLSAAVAARLAGSGDASVAELAHPVEAGGETIGFALALPASANGVPRPSVDREEVLRTAALAALAEVAVTDARDQVAADVRGTLLEDLRAGRTVPEEIASRAARLGCDLSGGAVVLIAEVRSAKPRHVAALIAGEHTGAIAEPLGVAGSPERVYAILPRRPTDPDGGTVEASANGLVARLRAHGPSAFSSFCADAGELARAVSEAELMLDVVAADERLAGQLSDSVGNGVYRLLFRALATDPGEVHRFYEDTVEPLVAHDREYRTDLLGTLEAYLANDCNMNATARTVFAHRHTVAHRLTRVRELTGLDPALGEDRERLGLGIKAYRILAPTLPR
jgi:sugar diacid utilization regulator